MTTDKSADDTALDDVFSSSRDRGARSAASVAEPVREEPTPEPIAPDKVEEPEASAPEPEAKPKGYRDPESGRFVPLGELQTEREKRQEAQKEREEEARLRRLAEDNASRLEKQVAEIQRSIAARTSQPPPPDPLMDPEGAFTHIQTQFSQQLRNQALDFSERLARRHHGNAAVDAAFKAAEAAGAIPQMINTADPYEELMIWHKRQQTLARVGDDPEAYEKRIREEARQQVIEELKAGKMSLAGGPAVPAPQPHQQPRFPTGLADATGAGSNVAQPVNDEVMMAGVFDSGRKRRA